MKIALVSKAIYPTRGGVELHVHNLALELLALGHHVQVFVAGNAARPTARREYVLHTGTRLYSFYRAFAGGKFDVVHAHGARLPIACAALMAGRSLGLRTVFTPHCFYPAGNWRSGLKRRLFDPTFGRWGLRQAQRIICLTENDRRDAIHCGADSRRIRIIPNSIRPPCFPGDLEVENFRRRHGLGTFLLYVGRLHRVKRGDFLISALARLSAKIGLLFVGPDAGCLHDWQRLAAKLGLSPRVRFFCELGDDDLRLAYRASAALVMASSYEGLPTVLLEAMALATPVVAADSGGIRHLIEHGANGLLYRYGDEDDFRRQVELCLSEPQTVMIERARQRVLTQYCWPANAGRIAELYQQRET